jgi:hypothetical protein
MVGELNSILEGRKGVEAIVAVLAGSVVKSILVILFAGSLSATIIAL